LRRRRQKTRVRQKELRTTGQNNVKNCSNRSGAGRRKAGGGRYTGPCEGRTVCVAELELGQAEGQAAGSGAAQGPRAWVQGRNPKGRQVMGRAWEPTDQN